MTQLQEYLFGIPLSTHRNREFEQAQPFPYEMVIAAISIAFFRTTIYLRKEPKLLRWFFGLVLGFLTYSNKSYELITSVEIFSYAVPLFLFSDYNRLAVLWGKKKKKNATAATTTKMKEQESSSSILLRLALVAMSAILSWVICHVTATGSLFRWMGVVTPSFVSNGLASALPINELLAAYKILDKFIMEPGLLRAQVSRLFFITFHIQVGIGYLGIDFLKQEQERRNQLVRLDTSSDSTAEQAVEADSTGRSTDTNTNTKNQANGKRHNTTTALESGGDAKKLQRSKRFQKSAAPFIFFTAVPYMVQIIFYGNLNAFSYACFKDDVHRAVRLYDLFDHDNHLVAVASHSAKSPEAYAGYMDTIVGTSYDLFNRKLFSLPKVLLLPMVMARQPQMIAQVFPIIFFTDWLKGKAVAYMTSRVEQLEKESQELVAMRSKVEAFDIKNAELLQRAGAGATEFTKRRWEELTVQVQMKTVVKDLTYRTKAFFAWIQRNFVFSVLVDCALAHLIAVGKIVSADIFVFSRAIEDAVDMALMKSRSEAELARLMTQINNMEELATVWENAKERSLLPCNLAPLSVAENGLESRSSMVVLRNLVYSRGTAMVRIDHLELDAGIYALTGANGSGKSTLFRVLMACKTNDRAIDLPPSIKLTTPFEPLTEKDDMEGEMSCKAADQEVEKSEDESLNSDVNARNLAEDVGAMSNETHPSVSVTMPSSHVVEISQTFYWPLYTKPIDWIYQEHVTESYDAAKLDNLVRRVAEELHALEFTQSVASGEGKEPTSEEGVVSMAPSEEAISTIMGQLLEEKEDWFNDLSGGQRSKVELVRKVFLQEECPRVLLVDETMAPLDPRSKSLVMSSLKAFCSDSVVIVIYHTDVGREQDNGDGEAVECVPSNDFFDANIHVENKMISIRPVC